MTRAGNQQLTTQVRGWQPWRCEKGLDFGHILKAELVELADKFDVRFERNGGSKDVSQDFSMSNSKTVVTTPDEEA